MTERPRIPQPHGGVLVPGAGGGPQPGSGRPRKVPVVLTEDEVKAKATAALDAVVLKLVESADVHGLKRLAKKRAETPDARRISARTRVLVLERDGFRCRRCGSTPEHARLVVDHIDPVAKGGGRDRSNLQTLCEPCNAGKGARAPHAHDRLRDGTWNNGMYFIELSPTRDTIVRCGCIDRSPTFDLVAVSLYNPLSGEWFDSHLRPAAERSNWHHFRVCEIWLGAIASTFNGDTW